MWPKLKNKLKNLSWFYFLNSQIKAKLTIFRLESLAAYYQKQATASNVHYDEGEVIEKVRKDLAGRGIKTVSSRPLRIFWVGAHEAQDNSGFLAGLRSLGEVFTFKNKFGQYGLWGATKEESRQSVPEIVVSNSVLLLGQVSELHHKKPIDLLMGQMWAEVLDVEALKKIRAMGIVTVNVSMDDKLPALWKNYKGRRMGSVGLAGGLDLILTTTAAACLWYLMEGVAAIYWPLASDPHLFYPRQEKKYDVVFIGSKYGLRGPLVMSLIKAGVKVSAFGPGWPNGSLDAAQSAEAFGQAKIILGTGTIGYNEDIFTIKLRDFDAPMSGALYITHRNPDLLQLFEEGKEIECYATISECVQKIKFYLAHPEKLNALAAAGLKKARAEHTWSQRIKKVLDILNLR